ncbi:hypothetical protein OAM47_03550 [Gammaproteobacteria bacterium]|jgi:hypothetical protein|nr:hypothetical protein [Gammaproteobacteria bacterium]MDC0443215.1 hypothetical protein [Gammaproteobacteria bacterium]|tara:strand:+ start:348 stop:581 length:234 start_codon:yes stop_codon:yes gene_type:complete
MKIFLEKGISHLDLHGIKHNDVDDEILDFTFQHQDQLPLLIICGNSNKMIEIASKTLKKASIEFSSPRFGILRIEKV